MSFEGLNFDILSGLFALALALYARQREEIRLRRLAWVFNIVGILLLANIVGVAIASAPFIAAFGPERLNTWVTQVPFVWLPTVFVLFALVGHILLTRRLLAADSGPAA